MVGRDGCLGGERENENENETKPAEVVCRVDWLLFVSRDRLCLGLLGCFSSRHFVSERSASSGYQREVEGIAHFNSAALCVRSDGRIFGPEQAASRPRIHRGLVQQQRNLLRLIVRSFVGQQSLLPANHRKVKRTRGLRTASQARRYDGNDPEQSVVVSLG